ncbi:VENN motif pre-toxin domain-containing protein [Aeromonas allosaccharophila]|uniref:HNH/ENDO VII family nuclease n=1 Tax=Aeromonas allosaccharophila TaxID=656 RepID=A0AAX3NT16_9GAMM|nr:VENN motif pre-toxin domain-containing protein [Aeromonas allosaccharophila]WED76057.1 HNH/ENDO VII family nuclease [Aeromonas allosaccharophila]
MEQTGIFAGKQGFDIRVGDHTQLNGAVLAGSDNASNNRLSTNTLGWSDLHNRADYQVESQSIGISGSCQGGKDAASPSAQTLLNGSNRSGSASSTTFAAISNGHIELRSPDQQQQDVTTLLRDPSKAANGLPPIFDKKKELEKLQEVQLIGEVGQQATQLVASEKMGKAEKQARENKEYANSEEYKALQEKWGVGSDFQRGMQAATAALQGLAGGGLAEAAAGAASPYIAKLVKDKTDEGPSRILAHALTQGALAAVQNKSAMVGATGAATGELVGMMATNLYHKDVSELTEGEKDTVSTLATLAAGLAGGLSGGDTAHALAGAQTGKTVVENNLLSPGAADIGFWLSKSPDCDVTCKANIAKGVAEGNLVVSAGLAGVAGGAMIVGATPEIVAAAKVALEGCKAAPVICLNNAGLQVAEAVTPGGIGAAGAIGVGKTAAEATAAKAEAIATRVAKSTGENINIAKYFGQERKYWSSKSVEINGNKVYQRNDLFNPNAIDARGRTNIQRMEKGLAPLDSNGDSINLHHMLQRQDGPLAEVTQSFHTDNRQLSILTVMKRHPALIAMYLTSGDLITGNRELKTSKSRCS